MQPTHPADHLVRIIAQEAGVRALACATTHSVREAVRRQQATPIAAVALGYGLTAATLLGALLKVQQRVAVKVDGHGPLGKLVAESDSYGHIRGYVANPQPSWAPPVEASDVASALGSQGMLTIVKDLGVKDLYEGVVPIQTGQLDTDLVYYLIKSEQVPSLVEIGVHLDDQGAVAVAGGVLIQALPGHDLSTMTTIADHMDDLPPLTELLAEGQTPGTLLDALFAGIPYVTLEERAVAFRCSCSRERSAQALRMLEVEDLVALIAEGEAVVDCHFCRERYTFGREVLEELLAQAEQSNP